MTKSLLVPFICALAALPVSAPASEDESWQFGASIYGWFPDVSGQTAFPQATGGGEFEIDIDTILDNLEFTLMGTFEARKGRWGVFTDLIFMDIGDSESGVRDATIGGTRVPVNASGDVDVDMKSFVGTMVGYYRAVDRPDVIVDVLGGFRYVDVQQEVSWSITGNVASIPLPDRTGTGKAEFENWDVVVGTKGKLALGAGKRWFVPYYLDMGTGESDFTWQGITGIGYAFHWGETTAVWRYLSYDLPSGSAISDMIFSGPAIGVTFRW